MAFFNIKNGRIMQMAGMNKIDADTVAWLTERLILNDEILPEKFLIIGRGRSKRFGSDMLYLLGLDKNAALVIFFVSGKVPDRQKIGSVCELSWNLRGLPYNKLENIAKKHFTNMGATIDSLSELHNQYFNIDRSVSLSRYNETQQAVIIAPGFDQDATDSICWHRAEIDIKAFSFNVAYIDKGERLLMIHPEIKGGTISSVMSAIGGVPSALMRRISKNTVSR